MKNNYFFKAVFTLIMCGSITLASAADIYLSNTGLDTNDGLSAGTAVKTLSKAFTISLAGDVIHVMNTININEEPIGTGARATIDITGLSTTLVLVKDGVTYTTWNAVNGTLGIIPHTRSVTIIGDDKATCGFDGNNASCIIRQDHSSGTAAISYKNLTFKNGNAKGDNSGGGAFYLRQTNSAFQFPANFYNCDFITNVSKKDKPGGAVSILPGAANFKLCRFAENIASKGAGLYVERGDVKVDSCVFENHDITVASDYLSEAFANASVGAAMHANLLSGGQIINLDVKNTLFKNNKAGANGGAFSTSEANAITAGTTNVKFTNCAFVNNSTLIGTGGAVHTNNFYVGLMTSISFINSTFSNNSAGANTAGAISVNNLLAGSKFDLINCTVSGNKVSGTTGAGGAGVRFLKASAEGVRKIQNCIVENNTAVDANMTSAADYADLGMENIVDPVTFVETPNYVAGTTLIIEKSLIGSCKNVDFETQFPLNKTNYVFELNGSIVNSYKAKLGVFNEEKNYFPLLAASEAIGYGLTSYLSGLTPAVMTDQIGRNRPAVNCSAGAYEYATIAGLKNTVNNSLVVYKNTANQLIVKNNDDNQGIITVCNMMGQVVATAQMTSAVTTINTFINAGAYIVMVTVNGEVSTQKVILN